jgi:uncharacterized protein YkwD
MRLSFFLFLLAIVQTPRAQVIDSLNTARNCGYMNADEREMIYEINRLRSRPSTYLPYIQPLLDQAKKQLREHGKGARNYSLSFTYNYENGVKTTRVDTNWHYANEEDVKALQTLVNDLKRIKHLSVLKADSGIYCAALKHADDQDGHDWTLMHTGSDGSAPWDRITGFSPKMSFGNENIAGRGGYYTTPRGFIIQLLVDAGIPGYGHRYNILDPSWTHIACVIRDQKGVMTWCIQNFGVIKKNQPALNR